MATTPGALNKAIIARLRATEVLTGLTLTAQQALTAVIPKWRLGSMTKGGTLPSGNFWKDAGVEAMNAPDVGIIRNTVVRFEVWTGAWDDSFFTTAEDSLELLFDQRRGAPKLTLTGDGRVYYGYLFTEFQGPFHDDNINAFFGMIAFTFVEARPY